MIVEGNLDVNFEYNRKNIRSRKITTAHLTQVRQQAKEMGLFDGGKRISLIAQSEEKVLTPTPPQGEKEQVAEDVVGKEDTNFEAKLEEKIIQNKTEKPEKNQPESALKEYTIELPAGTRLEQIHTLKDFLHSQELGDIQIYILLSGQKVDTKIALVSLTDLKVWVDDNL